jgi:hypothetical protein
MHRDNIVLSDLAGMSRGMPSKQFVTELHDRGFARDEAIEVFCRMFGVPRGAGRLFVASHPAWAAETVANDSDGSIPAPGCHGAMTSPSKN